MAFISGTPDIVKVVYYRAVFCVALERARLSWVVRNALFEMLWGRAIDCADTFGD